MADVTHSIPGGLWKLPRVTEVSSLHTARWALAKLWARDAAEWSPPFWKNKLPTFRCLKSVPLSCENEDFDFIPTGSLKVEICFR